MTGSFGARLQAAMHTRGAFCAGIDPHPQLLQQWELPVSVNGLESFALRATEAIAPEVAAIKPQSAFFERFGAAGISVLERVIQVAQAAGAVVILDVKRGDIGSTAQAYAEAYLQPESPLSVDAITASPYLGIDSLAPMFELASRHDRGVFVLALTSNPEAVKLQQAHMGAGVVVAQGVLQRLGQLNADSPTLGSFGAVVGATVEPPEFGLEFGGPILAPGVGAQGGDVNSLRRIFEGVTHRVLPTSSRQVLRAGPKVAALREAVARSVAEFGAING